MQRYFIRLSFKGTAYHGWQAQENAVSVQQVISEALSLVLRNTVEITGCGRTDTGVHAKVFYAHFEIEKELGAAGCEKLMFKLNSLLPKDIAIHSIFHVPDDAHTRFSATSRTYQYFIARSKNPFETEFAWYYSVPLDVKAMNKGAGMLIKFTDFSCFSRSHTQTKTNLCKITEAHWEEDNGMLIFTITADRFLRNMVRAIVGTLIEMGKGKLDDEGLKKIILSKKRSNAGKSVPACGLFLTGVEFPEEILKTTSK